jgi:hypothetical protein
MPALTRRARSAEIREAEWWPPWHFYRKAGPASQPRTTLHLQTPVGSLAFQQLADRARDLGTGARLKGRLLSCNFGLFITERYSSLAAGRVELFAGLGGAYGWNSVGGRFDSAYGQGSAGARFAVDRSHRFWVGTTLRGLTNFTRPQQAWLPWTVDLGFRFGHK